MKNDKIAYATAFCSYLIERIEGIRSIVLFGSVARNTSDKESDVDIFIDTMSVKKEKIDMIIENFYKSQIFNMWRLKGVKNPISVIVDNLESKEWENLKRSIITDGIILFGKYKSKPEKLDHYMLFSYADVKNTRKRINLHRKLFGYKIKNKHYEGIISKFNGKKYGKGTFSVPIQYYNEIKSIFIELRITPKITEIWIER